MIQPGSNGRYTFAQIEQIWESAGGSKLNAAMAAAIAMAESGGNPNATNNNGNGSVDRGLWQVNSVHGSLSSYDVTTNARAAVEISKNGTTWRPWCTAYSDGLCGTKGGTYLGAGAPFLKFLGSGSTGSATSTGTNTSPTTTLASYPTVQNTSWYNWIIPFGLGALGGATGDQGLSAIGGIPLGGLSSALENGIATAIGDVLKPLGRAFLHGWFVVGGAALMLVGVYFMFSDAGMADLKPESGMDDSKQVEQLNDNGELSGTGQLDQNRQGSRRPSNPGNSTGGRSGKTFQSTDSSSKQSSTSARQGRSEKAAQKAQKAAGVAEDAAVVAA